MRVKHYGKRVKNKMTSTVIEKNKDMNKDVNKEKLHSILAARLEKSKLRENVISNTDLTEYVVSSMQRSMLEREELSKESGAYNLASRVDVEGAIDIISLQKAIDALIASSSSLRTGFVKSERGYLQVIDKDAFSKIEYIDICNGEAGLDGIIEERAVRKFEFDKPSLFKVTVIKTAPKRYVILLVSHHAVTDGWSFGVIVSKLQDYYNEYKNSGCISLEQEKVSFIDFTAWKQDKKNKEKEFWKKELDGSAILRLDTDAERSIKAVYPGRRLYFDLDRKLSEDIRLFAKDKNLTIFSTIMGAYQILLGRYTGQRDFVVGMAESGRDNLATTKMIGCFINSLGMRANIDIDSTAGEFLGKVREHFYDIMAHKDIDIYECVEDIDIEQDYRYPVLFQTMFNYENTPKTRFDFDGLSMSQKGVDVCNALFDITLSLFDDGEAIGGFIEYKSEIFSRKRIERMRDDLIGLIGNIIADPERKICEIPLVSPKQEAELIAYNHRTEFNPETFIERFTKIASKYADNTALCYEEKSISYKELDERSGAVAEVLREREASGAMIGMFMDKSIEAVVALVGILKAGMVYVPIDTGYPDERITYIAQDAGIEVIITGALGDERIRECVPEIKDVIPIDSIMSGEYSDKGTGACDEIEISGEDTAYVIYTSGSTGKPKGVQVPHRGICNVIDEEKKLFDVKSDSRILQFASFCFDASVFEIVMALGNGAALYIVDKQKVIGNALSSYIKNNSITHICVTPSVLALTSPKGLDELETVIVAGEACPEELIDIWGRDHKFFNAYGPTEATIWTTTKRCLPGEKVTIGKPVTNTEVYVLDEWMNPVGIGREGELYIGGIGLSKGYLGREDLNKEKFVTKRFSNGYETKLYASGDVVCLNDSGELEFKGRKDSQVKLRGFRIETDEIRNVAMECEGIADAVVGVTQKGETKTLYLVVKGGRDLVDTNGLKEHLKNKLPYYMVPAVINVIDSIPLTWNGKADLKAIENNLIFNAERREVQKPENEIQEKLAGLWKKVLETEDVGIDDNFFELGGHSLTATKLSNVISESFGKDFTTAMVFGYPTIREMEKLFSEEGEERSETISRIKRTEKINLSPQQRQMWFAEQMGDSNGSYNIVMPIRLRGNLNVERLEESFKHVIRNNENLRTSFKNENGIPYQTIRSDFEFSLRQYYLMNFEGKDTDKPINSIISAVSKQSFDLEKDLLIRGYLVYKGKDEYVLIVVMHHIISDGWSMELMTREIAGDYNNEGKGNIAEEKLSYIDYIYWLDERKEATEKQKEFWKKTLSPDMEVVSLPTDYIRPDVQTHNGYTVTSELDKDLTSKIKAFCKDNKITTFMFMLTAFSVLLHKLTGNTDIPIGVPIAGRGKKETEDMIGFFVNTLVMRCSVDGADSIQKCLENARDVSLKAYENQDVSFEELVRMLVKKRDLSRSPLVQVMLNVQNPDGINFDLKGLEVRPYPIIQENTKYDLTLYVEEYFGKMNLRAVYNSDLFKQERMQEFMRQFATVTQTVLEKKNVKIEDISLIGDEFINVLEEKNKRKKERNITATETLYELVEESISKYPDRVAISFEDEDVTYKELDKKVSELSGALRERGIKSGDKCIIYGFRSTKLIIAMLAVLKAGGVFSIFDPEYPEERLKNQFDAVKAKGVILLDGEIPKVFDVAAKEACLFETYADLMELKQGDSGKEKVRRQAGDEAYVLFTSGTTGTPNLICTPHEPVVHFIKWFIHHYRLSRDCTFAMFAGLTHDPLMREVFTPLALGGRLAIRKRASRYDLDGSAKWMAEQGVTDVNITPSLFMMIAGEKNVYLPDVRHYYFGGEKLGAAQVEKVRKISPKAMCSNFYGATETPQVMGYYDIPDDYNPKKDVLPISGGIHEVDIYPATKSGNRAGLGELGEIYIETRHLSKGYLNNERLNKEKFITSKKDPLSKIYKTGDVGRYLADGSILIEGRADDQINVRGYRIESGEIELALLKKDNVRNAHVRVVNSGGRDMIVAYLVLKDGSDFKSSEMRNFLCDYLPVNVLPEHYEILDNIPLTPNGKVDYRKLPKDFKETKHGIVKPSNETEEKVLKIWNEILGRDDFGTEDNFFDVGGHSLILSQLKVRLEQEFETEVKLVDLFGYPTVSMISEHIQTSSAGERVTAVKHSEASGDRAKKRNQSLSKFKKR